MLKNPKLKIKYMDRVEVEWEDSIQNMEGWLRAKHFDWDRHYKAMGQKTIGYFLKATNSAISLVQSRSTDEDAFSSVWSIPIGCVTKINKLK